MTFPYWIPIIYWFLMSLASVFDAGGDAVGKVQKWFLSKTYQIIVILSYCAMIPLATILPHEFLGWKYWLYFAIIGVFIRVGTFNAAWSLFRFKWTKSYLCFFKKKDGTCRIKISYLVGYWWYLGETPAYDRMLNWIIIKLGAPQKMFLGFLYVISWLVSLGILFDIFYLIPE